MNQEKATEHSTKSRLLPPNILNSGLKLTALKSILFRASGQQIN